MPKSDGIEQRRVAVSIARVDERAIGGANEVVEDGVVAVAGRAVQHAQLEMSNNSERYPPDRDPPLDDRLPPARDFQLPRAILKIRSETC